MITTNAFPTPVSALDLKVGEAYFMLNYFDDKLLTPDLRTLIFIGRDAMKLGDALLYFQDPESFASRGANSDFHESEYGVFHCTEEQLACIFTLDNAIHELNRCVVRQAKERR